MASELLDLPVELRDHPRYRIVRLLGRGGMGVVYLAEHRVLEKPVAVKVMSGDLVADAEAVERFRREVRAAGKLEHRNIVRAYDAEEAGGLHLLAMEYVDGKTLDDVVDTRGPLPLEYACSFVRQAALGLQYAHELGMVHRDIKPTNLMVTAKGQVKILDFGLAKLASERRGRAGLTAKDVAIGTPEYMAPEQARSTATADVRADIYALGGTLFFLLTGRLPFAGQNSIEVALKHITDPVPRPSDLRAALPPALDELVVRMLAKQPADRPQTPNEVAHALQMIGKSPTVAEEVTTAAAVEEAPTDVFRFDTPPLNVATTRRVTPRPRKRWLPFAIIGGFFVPVAASALVLALREGEKASSAVAKRNPDLPPKVTVAKRNPDPPPKPAAPKKDVPKSEPVPDDPPPAAAEPPATKVDSQPTPVPRPSPPASAPAPARPSRPELFAPMGQFGTRLTANRAKLVEACGGSAESEAAVSRGLQWLARNQKNDGRWDIDGTHTDPVAGTSLGLLPFLAAGHTHKPVKGEKESAHAKNVEYALGYIRGKQKANGSFGTKDMYGHAIATQALCEAYGMTRDTGLRRSCQAALDYLVKAQHPAGGFRYQPGQAGDTSVTGWCLVALQTGKATGFAVPESTFAKVASYLDTVQQQKGAAYGYQGPGDAPATTAVGLLCRERLGWGATTPVLAEGVANLRKTPPGTAYDNCYFFYYATQVVYNFGGDDWDKDWNPKMRNLLVATQDNDPTSLNRGSWIPDQTLAGKGGGRLTATVLALLTLEVYYRYPPTGLVK